MADQPSSTLRSRREFGRGTLAALFAGTALFVTPALAAPVDPLIAVCDRYFELFSLDDEDFTPFQNEFDHLKHIIETTVPISKAGAVAVLGYVAHTLEYFIDDSCHDIIHNVLAYMRTLDGDGPDAPMLAAALAERAKRYSPQNTAIKQRAIDLHYQAIKKLMGWAA